jgi:hypothetical protein
MANNLFSKERIKISNSYFGFVLKLDTLQDIAIEHDKNNDLKTLREKTGSRMTKSTIYLQLITSETPK